MKDLIVKEIISKYWKKLKKLPNVVGYSEKLQPRILESTGEIIRQQLCFRVYVSFKDRTIKPENPECIPRKLKISGKNLGFKSTSITIETDVVNLEGIIEALEDNKKETRPLVSGVSANHYSGGACTGSFFFKDRETKEILYSGNCHCFAREGKAKIGDIIIQPSPLDGGTNNHKIGHLVKYVPIHFNHYNCKFREALHKLNKLFKKAKPNRIDKAWCSLIVPFTVQVFPNIKISGKAVPHIGEEIWKVGRTTGLTKGKVIDTDWAGKVEYSRGTAWFEDCILAKIKIRPGDSGSPTGVTREGINYAIGTGFAGSETTGVFSKILNEELEGNVELVTS